MRGEAGAKLREGEKEGEKLRTGARLREGDGEKLRMGARLRDGAGPKLREVDGVTRIRSGLTLRGSGRMRSRAAGRGMEDHDSEGKLRRTDSRGRTRLSTGRLRRTESRGRT